MATNYNGSDDSIRTFLTAVDMTLRRRSEYEERQIRLKQLDNQMQEQVAKSQVDVIGAEIAKMKTKFDGEAAILGLAQGERKLAIEERNAASNEVSARALARNAETGISAIDLQAKARAIMDYDLAAVAGARKDYIDAVGRGASVYTDSLPDIIGRQYMVTAEDGVNMVIGKNAPILSSKGPASAFKTWNARGFTTPDRWLSETTATAEKYMTTFGMLDGGRVANTSGGQAAQYGYAFAELEGFLGELAGSRDASKVAAALAAKKAMRDKIDEIRDPNKTGKPSVSLKPDDAEAVLQAGLDSLHAGGAVRAMWTSENAVNWNADLNSNLGGARPMTTRDLLSSVYGQYGFMISGNGGKMWQAKAMAMEEIAYRQAFKGEAEKAATISSQQYEWVMSGDPEAMDLGVSRKVTSEVEGRSKSRPVATPKPGQVVDAVGAVAGAVFSPQVDDAIDGLSLFNPSSAAPANYGKGDNGSGGVAGSASDLGSSETTAIGVVNEYEKGYDGLFNRVLNVSKVRIASMAIEIARAKLPDDNILEFTKGKFGAGWKQATLSDYIYSAVSSRFNTSPGSRITPDQASLSIDEAANEVANEIIRAIQADKEQKTYKPRKYD